MLDQIFGKKKYTETEKTIVDFVEQNPRLVVDLSLDEFSRLCFCSQASIIRFCKKLGIRGFNEFKVHLAKGLSTIADDKEEIHVDMPLAPNSSPKMIAETFLSLSTQALQTTFNNIDYNLVKRSAIALSRSDLVHIYGRGESLVLAEDFHYKLIRLGIMSSLESLNGFPEVKHFSADKKIKHTALIVSQFCNSMQVKHVLAELVNAKIPYILITASENAWPYDNLALATLRITNIEGRYKMGTFFSRTSIQFLLDCLFGNIFMLDYEKNKENLALFYKRSEERKRFYNSHQL